MASSSDLLPSQNEDEALTMKKTSMSPSSVADLPPSPPNPSRFSPLTAPGSSSTEDLSTPEQASSSAVEILHTAAAVVDSSMEKLKRSVASQKPGAHPADVSPPAPSTPSAFSAPLTPSAPSAPFAPCLPDADSSESSSSCSESSSESGEDVISPFSSMTSSVFDQKAPSTTRLEGLMATGSESALCSMVADVGKGASKDTKGAGSGPAEESKEHALFEAADSIPDSQPCVDVVKAEESSGKPAAAGGVRAMAAGVISLVKMYVALFIWLGLFHFLILALALIFVFWPHPLAVTSLVLLMTSLIVPVNPDSRFGQRIAKFVATHGPAYFPLKVIFEEESSLDPDRAYVIAFEPHHVLPIAAMAFCPASGMVPLPHCRCLGSSALDWVPVFRHVWRWLGVEAVTRTTFAELLQKGVSCVVVPGGMRESLLIEEDREVLYLKHRKGFVRMAVSAGTPIVPVFAFGQRKAFKWAFPKSAWYTTLSKKLLYAPMAFWGVGGGPIPMRHPMTVVVGKPIDVTWKEGENSKHEDVGVLVDALHAQYLNDLQGLYHKYKKMAGAENVPLIVH